MSFRAGSMLCRKVRDLNSLNLFYIITSIFNLASFYGDKLKVKPDKII